ncbi:MAG: N-acetylmuramoyl-L-alanine amidase family protein [Stenotrophomonas sp.]|uniref:N-acetylmuramoyl-L-alanine amidase family protein n=1 Tax=Stenotrophomonas sp. TaxID=69392 RepID=UPI003D6CB88E
MVRNGGSLPPDITSRKCIRSRHGSGTQKAIGSGLRDYDEDINSRPLLANHLGSNVAIHLHTNGNDFPQPRGVEVVAQPGRPEDARLASAVLCSMQEQVRSIPSYAAFPFAARPVFVSKGENRLARMPSVIVEVAYHSNPDDAAALQDPAFRSASMKGVEKGYRLFRDGKSCEPFVLQPIPDVSLATGASQEIALPFAGHPQFPVTMEFTTANCSSPGACRPSRTTFDDPNAPIAVVMRCAGNLAGTARWSVVLRDVDGVATAPVEFQQTCSRPGAPPAA